MKDTKTKTVTEATITIRSKYSMINFEILGTILNFAVNRLPRMALVHQITKYQERTSKLITEVRNKLNNHKLTIMRNNSMNIKIITKAVTQSQT